MSRTAMSRTAMSCTRTGCIAATSASRSRSSGASASAGTASATTASASATTTTTTAATATASEQRAGCCDHHCRYEGYCQKLGYPCHDDLLFVLGSASKPRNAGPTVFVRSFKIEAPNDVPRKEKTDCCD
jgi:hypothetical protein